MNFRCPFHGGDIDSAEQRFGVPADGWLDLSTGINPRPYPIGEIPSECWSRLPGRSDGEALISAARSCYGLSSADVVAAPGTQALIQALPHLVSPDMAVSVLGPTYEEHARTWRANIHPLTLISSLEEEKAPSPILVVVTPNNPDGRRISHTTLQTEAMRRRLLVIDEAFVDPTPQDSLAHDIPPNTIILRSFGKFFGLAGIRLGFALGESSLVSALGALLGPWAVSGPALVIGARALSDSAWCAQTRAFLAKQSAALDSVLTKSGFAIVGGTALFRLVRAPHARTVYEHLASRGILVRIFTHTPDIVRFGLPADDTGLDRLAHALATT